jgi:NAD+ synthase (glutamine-hydrolysing)
MSRLRVGLAQVNAVVGDLDGNAAVVADVVGRAATDGCDLVVFPELVLTGYPPEDLLLRPDFVRHVDDALRVAAAATADTTTVAVVGFVDGSVGALGNAAAICAEGRVRGVYRKRELPNYSVFDEQRYFVPGDEPLMLWQVAGVPVGVTICEDAWVDGGPTAELGAGGASLIVNINASPFHSGKVEARRANLAARAAESGCAQVYVNLVGGQDELVFDGSSMVVDADGVVVHRLTSFVDELSVVDLDVVIRPATLPVVELTATTGAVGPTRLPVCAAVTDPVDEVYRALVLGTRDYVTKNGFSEVVIGLSGGVDSSLVATIAVDALGAGRVHGVALPSRYSSDHSVGDAVDLADRLGIDLRTMPIEPAHTALLGMLGGGTGNPADDGPAVGGPAVGALEVGGLTEQNLQSRIRAVVLMALSNEYGWLVLTTSNKSESAVGYSTIYGDAAGGLAVIKDVPKLLVYRLCEHRNEQAKVIGDRPPIPDSVLTKPPSAELRPDQRDDQSLPPYEVLDPIIEAYVEQDRPVSDLVARGFDPVDVELVVRLVDGAEYKRRQSPPGLRVTTKAFGKDRRLPITNGWRPATPSVDG